jgi:hypothetical protein
MISKGVFFLVLADFLKAVPLLTISKKKTDFKDMEQSKISNDNIKSELYEKGEVITKLIQRDSLNTDADQSRRVVQDFNDTYQSPEQYLDRAIMYLQDAPNDYRYSIPRWHEQPEYVEVWVEKDALAGTLKSILENRQVRIVPNRGFCSIAFSHDNVERLKHFQYEGKTIHILYLGDLDPSGEVIDEIIYKKLRQYGLYGVDFKRIAVTEEQTRQFNLPHNPDPETLRKLRKDTRAKSFVRRHNGELFQIEVDALQAYAPEEFKNMVQQHVDKYFDNETDSIDLLNHTIAFGMLL